MDSEELLAQLADIHLPEPVSYWPPAIGWWILALLALAVLLMLARKFAGHRRQQKTYQHAQAELERCYHSYSLTEASEEDNNKLRYVNRFNTVIRRVALARYPQTNVAGLDGASWVDFIREKGESSLMTEEIAIALQHGRFRAKCEVDVDAMQSFGQQWIKSLYSGSMESKDPATADSQGLSPNV